MAAAETNCNFLWDLHLKRALTMDLALVKLGCVSSSESTQLIVVAALAIETAIVLLTTAVPDFGCTFVSFATSLGQTVWVQLSTPSPPMPAGDITIRLIRMWLNHAVEVELPRLRSLVGMSLIWPVFDA